MDSWIIFNAIIVLTSPQLALGMHIEMSALMDSACFYSDA